MTLQEKKEELKKFLTENKVKFREDVPLRRCQVLVTGDLLVQPYNIAVHLSDEHDTEFFKAVRNKYKPFFIREDEAMEFIIEKMQNSIIERMQKLNYIYMKNKEKKMRKYGKETKTV